MTKTEKILEAIHKLIRNEVNRQMITVKQQILSELRQPKQSSVKQLTETRRPAVSKTRRPNIQYSTNPVLNELLASTMPMEDNEPLAVDKYGNPINIVTQDANGRMVNFDNPAVQGVLEAMNRDYSGMFEQPQKPVVKEQVTVEKPKPVSMERLKQSAAMSMLNMDDEDMTGIDIPDPFSEKDW